MMMSCIPLYHRMSYQDFSTNFQRLEICHLGPDALEGEGDEGTHWESQIIPGTWKRKVNAGGCRNYPGERSVTFLGIMLNH